MPLSQQDINTLANIIDTRIQDQLSTLIAGAANAMEQRFSEMMEGYAGGAMGTVWAQDFERRMQEQYETVVLMEAERIINTREEALMEEADAAEYGDIQPPVDLTPTPAPVVKPTVVKLVNDVDDDENEVT